MLTRLAMVWISRHFHILQSSLCHAWVCVVNAFKQRCSVTFFIPSFIPVLGGGVSKKHGSITACLYSPKFTFKHLANVPSKWLTVHSRYTFYQYECSLGIETVTLALLASCSARWATGIHFTTTGTPIPFHS